MVQLKKVHMEGIGEVLFEPSSRAKRLNVSVRPFGGPRVAVPRRTSFEAAQEFVRSKADWIRNHLDKIKELAHDHERLSKRAAGMNALEAKRKMAARLDDLAALHGFSYSKVTVRNLKSRWGSCSHKKNISLNMKLIVLPEEMLDYVILHELVHTRIANHSKAFWKALDRLVGDARALDLKLKRYDMMLLCN